jgi:hypothetical protein
LISPLGQPGVDGGVKVAFELHSPKGPRRVEEFEQHRLARFEVAQDV